jgi:hypothetical protein
MTISATTIEDRMRDLHARSSQSGGSPRGAGTPMVAADNMPALAPAAAPESRRRRRARRESARSETSLEGDRRAATPPVTPSRSAAPPLILSTRPYRPFPEDSVRLGGGICWFGRILRAIMGSEGHWQLASTWLRSWLRHLGGWHEVSCRM